jgi:hypothetical protein
LIHLVNDVKHLGCVDDFSAFVFENYLGFLKKLVRKSQKPLQQIIRRLHEEASLVHASSLIVESTVMFEHYDGPLLPGFHRAKQYKRVKTSGFTLSTSNGNNCVLLDGCIPAVIRNILKTNSDVVLICSEFASVRDAFDYPLPSSRLNIFLVNGICSNVYAVSLSHVLKKCV